MGNGEGRTVEEARTSMIVINNEADTSDLRLTRKELWMLVCALNEVCNGVQELADDGEFQTRTGFERHEMNVLLDEVILARNSQ